MGAEMALRNEQLAFIGCGAMGEAMVKGLLAEKLVDPKQIVASHPRPARAEELATRYGIRTTTGNAEAVDGATLVTLAIKPQFFDEVAEDLVGSVDPGALVLTIVAGVRMAYVAYRLSAPAVVRVMPNTPGQIGRGISVWTATEAVDEAGQERARTILTALGSQEYVIHENELDMATALSGTGPAYVFMFMEALIDAGVHLGFSRRMSSRLVYETVRGSLEYAVATDVHIAKLRNQVTSPGGTSAEAQYQLEKGRMRTVLSDAVWAAYRRCVQLGEMVTPDHNGRPYPASKNQE
jgi:pyrroline-5-carboxylate reductase